MRVLYGAASSTFYHARNLQAELERIGVQCRVVRAGDVVHRFPSSNVPSWFSNTRRFKRLAAEFKPDIVMSDVITNFALTAIRQNIPVFLYLRGDYWAETAEERRYMRKSIIKRMVLDYRDRVARMCFEGSGMILPITEYLEGVVKSRFPGKPTCIFFNGLNPAEWSRVPASRLKHPCVGLLQNANTRTKIVEMLTLERVIPRFPRVTFYWAGGGYYQNLILERLNKFPNFVWLEGLQYPDGVREFLSEVDIYALVTGLDTLSRSLLEAQLLERPVVATRVGGVGEAICDSRYLVERGDADGLCRSIDQLLNDDEESAELGRRGRKHVVENFSVRAKAMDFAGVAAEFLDGRRATSSHTE